MPQKINCRECGEVLYEGDLLKSPQDVIKKFEGVCPKCKKELSFMTNAVKVQPFESK
ncbi:MAG: endonuclease Q family protein [Candidatus Bathyarchaeota archaeon]|nr:endonuclease Q family protein [Candidatus Bathyarchaeota archaeon]